MSNRDPYSDNSSVKEERAAQSITRCCTAHHGLVRACPRANRTFSLARNPIPCATSSTNEWRVAAPWQPWRSSGPGASSSGNTCCAIVSPLLGAASYRRAVKQLLTSVVREICTLRSVGAGARVTAPGHPVAVSNDRPYRDLVDPCGVGESCPRGCGARNSNLSHMTAVAPMHPGLNG